MTVEAPRPAFEFLDAVTSDLCFVARGAALEDVFVAAADALLAATVEDPRAVREAVTVPLVLEDDDAELLLLRFLGELVFLRDARGLLLRAPSVRVEAIGAGAAGEGAPRGRPGRLRLVATLAGEPLSRDRHALAADVKAVTAHGLRIAPSAAPAGGLEATVTLDV